MSKRILLAEDDENLGFLIQDALEEAGYTLMRVQNGALAMDAFHAFKPELCLLDVMLPSTDGFELASEIRQVDLQTPILFLTARSLKEDRLKGFQMGGDDYILKPFSMEELKMRIAVFIRRSGIKAGEPEPAIYAVGTVRFDVHNLTLHFPEHKIKLTQKEADILQLLWSKPNTLVKRDEILLGLWGDDDYFMGRSLDVFISKLRRYLKSEPRISIENTHNVGFTLKTGQIGEEHLQF